MGCIDEVDDRCGIKQCNIVSLPRLRCDNTALLASARNKLVYAIKRESYRASRWIYIDGCVLVFQVMSDTYGY